MDKWEGRNEAAYCSHPFLLPISYQFIEQSRLFSRASAEFKLNAGLEGNYILSPPWEAEAAISFTRERLNAYKWRTNASNDKNLET